MAAVSYRVRSWARARWRGAAALALVVALAGGGALTLLAGAVRTVTAPDRYSEWRGDVYDVSIEQSSGSPRTADLAALPAIKHVDMATFVFGGLTRAGTGDHADALVFAGTLGPFGRRLIEGREPDPQAPGEFAASRTLVEAMHARLGDTFDLTTLTQAEADQFGFDAPEPSGPALTATLVGVIDGPSELTDDYAVTVFPSSLLDEGEVGISASVGVASLEAGASIHDLRTQLRSLPGGEALQVEEATWIAPEVQAAVNALGQGLVVLGAIVFAASLVVLGQLLSRQLRLADTERTVLRSVGLSRTQLAADPVGRAAVAVVLGAVGAAGIAYLCSGLFPLDFARRVEPHPGRQLDLVVHGLGALGLAVTLLVWQLTALLLEATGGRGTSASTLSERMAVAVPNGQLSTAIRFAYAPTSRRVRTATTSFLGLAVVCAVLFGALTFGANLRGVVDEPAQYGANFDLALGAGATQVSPEVRQALLESPDVGAATLYGTTTGTVGEQSIDIVGMEQLRGHLEPEILRGDIPRSGDEIALGTGLARALDVGPGDRVEVAGASGPRTLTVTGVVLVPPIGGADSLGASALVSAEGFVALDPSAAMNTATVDLAPGQGPQAAGRIADLAGASGAGQLDPPPAIVNLSRVRNIPLLVAAAVGPLAMVSLGHVMLVAVRRRRHDLAILRAIGATPRWLTGVVHWQATLITAVVLLLAVPVGTALGRSVYRAFIRNVGVRITGTVPLGWLAATLVALFLLANLVAAVTARRTSRLSVAVVLAED